MKGWRILAAHSLQSWRRAWTPLNTITAAMAAAGAWLFGAQFDAAGRVLAAFVIVRGLPALWMAAGAGRAMGLLFRSEDNVLLVTQPVAKSAIFIVRMLQQYAWNVLPALLLLTFWLGQGDKFPCGVDMSAAQRASVVLFWYLLSAPLQFCIGLLLTHRFWAAGAYDRMAVALTMLGPALICFWQLLNMAQDAGPSRYAAPRQPFLLPVLGLCIAAAWSYLSAAMFRKWFVSDYSRLQTTRQARRTWLWGWHETAHFMIPRRARALVFRDIAVLFRGGFPRGLMILAALFAVPALFWYDVSRMTVKPEEALMVEFRLSCYVLFAAVIAAYVTAFDLLKTRAPRMGLDLSLPVSPGLLWFGHFSTTVLFQFPYLALMLLALWAERGNAQNMNVYLVMAKFAALTVLLGLHAAAFAFGEFDGERIGPEQSFVFSAATLGLATAVCMLKFAWLLPVFYLGHAGMVRKAMARIGRVEVTA